MGWFSVFKSQPHHEGRTYNDPNKLGRELTPKEVEENGEIFLLDAIKSMPHAEKRGNTVLLDPNWLDGMQPTNGLYGSDFFVGDKVFGFSFDFRDVHKRKLCIDFYYQRAFRGIEFDDVNLDRTERVGDFLKKPMCIHHREVPDNVEGDEDFSQADYKRTATPADDYAAFVYMTSDKELFNGLWNTGPPRGKESRYEVRMIVDNFQFKRLPDGRLQKLGFDDLSNEDILEMKNQLNKLPNNPIRLDSDYFLKDYMSRNNIGVIA